MKIEIEWAEPILLAKNRKILRGSDDKFEDIYEWSAVYFFSRKFGAKYQPFYVGKTSNVRKRIIQHLKTSAIVDVLRVQADSKNYIPQGQRYFHCGYFMAKRGQNAEKCISIVEKALIRQALAQPFELLNVRLKEFKTHELTFSGSSAGSGPYKAVEIPA